MSARLRPLHSVGRTVARVATFFVSFVLSAELVWTLSDRALSAVEEQSTVIGHDLTDTLRVWRRGVVRDRRRAKIALLGDSVLGAAPGEPTVPDATTEALQKRGARGWRIAVHTLNWPGWGIAAQYYLADEVVRARPDRIMLELNLRALGPSTPGDITYPELAGFVDTSRLWEAAWLPLSYAGLTLDRLLFYRLLVTSGLDADWAELRRRQANLFKLRQPFEQWFDQAIGSNSARERGFIEAFCRFERMLVPAKNRERESQLRDALGDALEGISPTHDRLRVLKATLDHFHRKGVPTIVWVAPVNIEHIRSLGLSLDGLERSLVTIRQIVESSGAGFVDFHALLPDRAFRDARDHVSPDGEWNGTAMLGEQLARVILWSDPSNTPQIRALLSDPERALQ